MKFLVSGFNTRAAAESGSGSGYEIVSLDCFGDLDHSLCCRLEKYNDNGKAPYQEILYRQMCGLLLREHFDGIICESGFENRPDLVKKLFRFGIPVICNEPDVISRLRNFPRLSRKLVAAGFNAPLTFTGSRNLCFRGNNKAGKGRWLRKPVRSGGGWGIDFVHDGARIGRQFLLQEYIEGLPCSFTFLAGGGRSVLLGVAEQLIGTASENNRPFGYKGNIFPLVLPARAAQENIYNTAAGIAQWLTQTFGLSGLHGVDFIHDGEKCWVVEVNPRFTASMELLELAMGLPMLKLHIEACRGILPQADMLIRTALPAEAVCYGKLVVFADCDMQILEHNTTAAAWIGDLQLMGIRDVSNPGTHISRGAPLVTLIVSGVNRSACLQLLHQLAQDILLNRTPLQIKRWENI